MAIKDLIISAATATGNVISREKDRMIEIGPDGRPAGIQERAPKRLRQLATEGVFKVAVSQTAHIGAKELAKRLSESGLKQVLKSLGKHPVLAAGSVFIVVDTAREGFRLVRGDIGFADFSERTAGNVGGVAGSAGGAYAGAIVGSTVMPLIGTAVGSVVGGVIGGISGDAYIRHKMRSVTGVADDFEDFEDFQDYDDVNDFEDFDE